MLPETERHWRTVEVVSATISLFYGGFWTVIGIAFIFDQSRRWGLANPPLWVGSIILAGSIGTLAAGGHWRSVLSLGLAAYTICVAVLASQMSLGLLDLVQLVLPLGIIIVTFPAAAMIFFGYRDLGHLRKRIRGAEAIGRTP